MNPIALIIGLVAIVYLLEKSHINISGGVSGGVSGGGSAITQTNAQGQQVPIQLPQEFAPPPYSSNIGQVTSGVEMGVGVGVSTAESVLKAGSSMAKAIPIVGAVFDTIFSSLMAASAQRAKEAVSENVEVGKFIPYFDQSVKQIANAVNTGAVSASQASQLFDQLMTAYYTSVTPHIQPGRNGCQGGSAAKPQQGGPLGHGACSATNGYYGCGNDKSWGAACCIGSVLGASVSNLKWALSQPNGATVAMCKIYGDKYQGASREGYNVTLKPVTHL